MTLFIRLWLTVALGFVVALGLPTGAFAQPRNLSLVDDCPERVARLVRPDSRSGDYPRDITERRRYGALHWYEHGLAATLAEPDALFGLIRIFDGCRERRQYCPFLDGVDFGSSEIKAMKALQTAAYKKDAKAVRKNTRKLAKALPESLPDAFLFGYVDYTSNCGLTDGMAAKLASRNAGRLQSAMEAATNEALSQQQMCERAHANFGAASASRPDTLFHAEHRWNDTYQRRTAKGELCLPAPLSLVNDAPMSGGDPLGDMPLDYRGARSFHWLTERSLFDRQSPDVTECKAAESGATLMRDAGHARLRPEEQSWLDDYQARLRSAKGRADYGRCQTIPERLARWGEEYVQHAGWVWPLDLTQPLDRERCEYAIWELPENTLDAAYKRWRSTNRVRLSRMYQEKRSYHCTRVPVAFAAALEERIDTAIQTAAMDAVRAENRRLQYYADNPPEPTLRELLEEYNRNYQPPTIIEERCYINQWGREHCYTRR